MGIGTQLKLLFGERAGPVREIHAGGGYWSQDSAVQVLGTPEAPSALWVRWPGGTTNLFQMPRAHEVSVSKDGVIPIH
jgi:hypothetical protein